jgi:APA family basic amino acid/polyamine antiporter
VSGRLPYAAARDGLAPAPLARLSARTGTPVAAIVVSSVPPALLLLLFFSQTLLEAYNFIALASTAMALVVLGVSCAAEIVLLRREPQRFTAGQRRRGPYWAMAGLAFVLLMFAGVGVPAALLAFVTALALAPGYLWIRRGRARTPASLGGP